MYMMCCATTYACVKLIVCTKKNSDMLDKAATNRDKEDNGLLEVSDSTELGKLDSLILERCRPL